jgi:hypothetical protein
MVYLVGAENDPELTFAFTMSVIAAAGGCIASVFRIIRGCQKVPRKPSRSLDSSICYNWDQCVLRVLWLLHPTSVQVNAHKTLVENWQYVHSSLTVYGCGPFCILPH